MQEKGTTHSTGFQGKIAIFKNKRKKHPDSFWRKGMALYIDGVSFAYNTNPCAQAKSAPTRTCRKNKEGLLIHCTAKAKKKRTGGSVAEFMVSVAYEKGVIGVHQYQGNIDGKKYPQIVREKFPDLSEKSTNPKGRYFIQDNDPLQNSYIANEAFE